MATRLHGHRMQVKMRVILLEVSHWHFPLYQKALQQADIEVVGVSDAQPDFRDRIAAYFGCPGFADYRQLLDVEDVDFAFVFGRHIDMPEIAGALIERGVPFALEKPGGLSATDVALLRRRAAARGLYVAVPFIFRVSELLQEIERLEGALPAEYGHLSFRFIAGPPSRYLENGSAWMLDPSLSGGGCTMNLAVHFIDLVHLLTGNDVASVYARMSNRVYGSPVEDYSAMMLTTSDGATAVIETGYAYPMGDEAKREFTFSLSSSSNYVQATDNGLCVRPRDQSLGHPVVRAINLDTDGLYSTFVDRVLKDFEAGNAPIANLLDLEAVMRVIDASYASDRIQQCTKPA